MGLTLSGVSFTYPIGGTKRPALDAMSLSVEPGELVVVVGATGSGKSTLMRLAAGLLDPMAGSVSIDGAPLGSPTAAGRIGLVFQDAESQLFADTLLDDAAFGPKNLGASQAQAEQQARAALARVGLDPAVFGARSPFTLSGGEARRAAIAGVLAMRPRYLLADEPTAGLDAAGRRAVRAIVSELRADTGVIVVTHSAEEFLGEAERVLVLAEGREAWCGQADALIDDPTPLLTAGLRPPALLQLQLRGRERGAYTAPFTLDPEVLASRLGRVI